MTKRAYRAAAVVTALVALAAAWLLYRGDFLSLSTPEKQVAAIRGYCSADETGVSLQATLRPVVVHDQIIGSARVLVFTDEKIPGLLGNIQFRRGILGGWQAQCAEYSAGPVIQSDTVRTEPQYRIVYAADCPPEVARYTVQANPDLPETLMAEGTVAAPSFFHIHETGANFFPRLSLFAADGTELDPRDYLASDDSVPSPGIGSAEVNMVYWVCAGILGIGYVIARYFWEGGKPKTGQSEKTP